MLLLIIAKLNHILASLFAIFLKVHSNGGDCELLSLYYFHETTSLSLSVFVQQLNSGII
jgi:hypothetical protein